MFDLIESRRPCRALIIDLGFSLMAAGGCGGFIVLTGALSASGLGLPDYCVIILLIF